MSIRALGQEASDGWRLTGESHSDAVRPAAGATPVQGARERICAAEFTIVGAGIAGLVLSLLLDAKGLSSAVIERHPDPRCGGRRRSQSINLALSYRGMRALEAAGVLDRLRPCMIPMYGRMVHGEQDDFQPYDVSGKRAIYSIRRDAIIAALLERIEETPRITAHFGCACSAVDLDRRIIRFEDAAGENAAATFRALVGADGCHSAVRAAIATHSGYIPAIASLEHGYKELHISPDLANQLQLHRNSLHIWPRGDFMLIALPNADQSFSATLFMPVSGQVSFAALECGEFIDGFLTHHLPRFTALAAAFRDQLSANSLGRLLTISNSVWNHGAALVIGDAAHAMAPFFGQGMNCALEDCRLLAECIESDPLRWPDTFAHFTRMRKPDTDAISCLSMENYVEMRQSVLEGAYLQERQMMGMLSQRHPDRVVPLYSMITFSDVPYAEALRRGRIQTSIVRQSSGACGLDMGAADHLIAQHLPPLSAVLA